MKIFLIINWRKNYLNQLLENLNQFIRKPPFIDNIWVLILLDMQLISKFDNRICFLLCVIDIYSIHAWVIPLEDKKVITTTNAFQKISKKSNLKPNKIWVNFYNSSMKS